MSYSNKIDIHVVLVRPKYPRNVGSVARVISNMNADRLIIIDRQCELNMEAHEGAAGAQEPLMKRVEYNSWDEFHENENEGVIISFCGKKNIESDTLTYEQRLQNLFKENNPLLRNFYLVFGPEDSGLNNEDLKYSHFITSLPTFGSFTSLNLSHAVLLALYILRQHQNSTTQETTAKETEQSFFYFNDRIITEWLETLGFSLDAKRINAQTVLNRILLKNLVSAKEMRVLEAILQQTVRKLKRPSS